MAAPPPPTHSLGSNGQTSLPVMLGRQVAAGRLHDSAKKADAARRSPEEPSREASKKREDSRMVRKLETLQFKQQDEEIGEPVFGQVFIALHLTRGIDHANVRSKESFYVVGNQRTIEALNAVWLKKEQLRGLCKDVKRLGDKLHLFEDEPYALCKKEKYVPVCMFVFTCALAIAATVSSIMHFDDCQAALMVAAGTLLGLTVMCCFCLNFRRRRILDWEVPHAELNHFAAEWSAKHGIKLRFEFHRYGPSYFVLKPRNLQDFQRIHEPDSSSEEEEQDPMSPSAPPAPAGRKASTWRPAPDLMDEPPV